VQYIELTIKGQPLRMAYMDVAPTADANGKTVVLLHGKSFMGDYGLIYLATSFQRVMVVRAGLVLPDPTKLRTATFDSSAKPPIFRPDGCQFLGGQIAPGRSRR
jgi:hypothetical protein